jgi:AGZA family xanthine/uracil permease-like MFS transporter
MERPGPPWFVAGDLDGFFGLFFSGFPDLLLIASLLPLCGLPAEMIAGRILPAVAFSILFGNLFYAWQARELALRTGRDDVTAIPFGINTPTIFAYVTLIMLPVYERTHDAALAYRMGILASLLSGAIQTASAFCIDWLRRTTPLAALLCPLAGLAMAFLCLGFIFGIFQSPQVALLPAVILMATYASRLQLPWRIPAGFVAMAVGALLVAILRWMHLYALPPQQPLFPVGLYLPRPVNVFHSLTLADGLRYMSIILPLALLDTLASLQILESVRLAGDEYKTTPSLLVNGLATLAGAALGSAFPTSLYIGHNAHKANGARIGYSILGGVVSAALCLSGLVPAVLHVVPLEVVAFAVVWFGLATVGQAFQEVPRAHCVAVALGLIPLLAQWVLQIVDLSVRTAGSDLLSTAPKFGGQLAIYGLIALGQGSLLTSMVWAASLAWMIDRRFLKAAWWMLAGAVFSCLGLIHAYQLTPQGVQNKLGWWAAPEFTLSYLGAALFLLLCHWYAHDQPDRFAN